MKHGLSISTSTPAIVGVGVSAVKSVKQVKAKGKGLGGRGFTV